MLDLMLMAKSRISLGRSEIKSLMRYSWSDLSEFLTHKVHIHLSVEFLKFSKNSASDKEKSFDIDRIYRQSILKN